MKIVEFAVELVVIAAVVVPVNSVDGLTETVLAIAVAVVVPLDIAFDDVVPVCLDLVRVLFFVLVPVLFCVLLLDLFLELFLVLNLVFVLADIVEEMVEVDSFVLGFVALVGPDALACMMD